MAPIRNAVHIVWADMAQVRDGYRKLEEFEHLNHAARNLLDELAWWAKALKTAREADVEAGRAKAA